MPMRGPPGSFDIFLGMMIYQPAIFTRIAKVIDRIIRQQ
jgi:hypothetical protein